MPNRRKKGKRRTGGRSGSSNVDRDIVSSHKVTGSTTNIVSSDMTSRRQNFQLVQRPPRGFLTQTYWTQFSVDTQLSVSAISVGESNLLFTAAQFPGTAAYIAAFDQYCIYSVTASYVLIQSSDTEIRLYTALDYDNVTNIGKSGILNFGTYNFTSLTPGTSLVRYVKPCLAPTVSDTTPLDKSALIGRMWVDSGYTAIPHYGLRQIVDIGSSTIANIIEVSLTAVFGWRNSI